MAILTATVFAMLLERLDPDEEKAAIKYEELRLKIVKYFVWRGCITTNADALADEALDRIAVKLGQTVQIQNINAYTLEISRYIWLEFNRKNKEEQINNKTLELQDKSKFFAEPDLRLSCLKSCLLNVVADSDDRLLILDYYGAEENEKNKNHRKKIAESAGLTTNALKVKTSRLRIRLEKCINLCVKAKTKSVTK